MLIRKITNDLFKKCVVYEGKDIKFYNAGLINVLLDETLK